MKTMTLRELREDVGMTQIEVSKKTGMQQSGVSKFECRDDHSVSLLKKYLRALGCRLEVVAVFKDKTFKIV